MPEIITDGTGKGYRAQVGSDQRLHVWAKSSSNQHIASEENEQAFQVIGTATLSSGSVTVLHIKNTDVSKLLVVNYIRHQIVTASGGTSFPNDDNYLSIGLNRTYASGGSSVTAANVYGNSGNISQTICYDSNPTLTGTVREIDRWYTKAAGDMNVFDKEGSIILPPNGTLELSYVGDKTSGTVYSRVSFHFEEVGT